MTTTEESVLFSPRYRWAKWAISAGVFMFLLIFAVQFLQVARLLLQLPAGISFGELLSFADRGASQTRLLHGIGLLLLTAIIALIVFLLTANFWGLGTCLQGIGLGFLWLMLISGVGGAWSGNVVDGVLIQLNCGDSARYPPMPICCGKPCLNWRNAKPPASRCWRYVIVKDAEGILEDDGLIAWLAARLSQRPLRKPGGGGQAARGSVLMASNEAQDDVLGGDYVGQRFLLRRSWSFAESGFLGFAGLVDARSTSRKYPERTNT